MSEGKSMRKFTGNFSCVYCGKKVNYDPKKKKLICSNLNCPEGDPSYGGNPLAGCVWGEIVKGREWVSVDKEYALRHIVRDEARVGMMMKDDQHVG